MSDFENRDMDTQQEFYEQHGEYVTVEDAAEFGAARRPLPVPFPFPRRYSGLYTWSQSIVVPPTPIPAPPFPPVPIPSPPLPGGPPQSVNGQRRTDLEAQAARPALPILFGREELRLDVDGLYPQMAASGTSYSRFTEVHHWIASLTSTGANAWSGAIWHKDGNTSNFPYTRVDIKVSGSGILPQTNKAHVTFSGGGIASFGRIYRWKSSAYRPVEFEFDTTEDANPVLSIKTDDHPVRPAGLIVETLSVEEVFRRAGFGVTVSGGESSIPRAEAGTNGTWSDAEMHDAMQTYWSRFSDAPRWSLWTLSAALHDQGTSLGGIMFDDIGPHHRQGTAVFTESFIRNPPPGEAAPEAWVRRMKFWTTAHEMGHAFNLAHSWQKSLGSPWLPLADEPEARSFMNYPYAVAGGQSSFFADFEFRFSDAELLFLRHAPSRFVQMGNANWFDHHGFLSPDAGELQPEYRLEVRANRGRPVFEFLEPVVLELKLTNISPEPKIVRANILSSQSILTIIKREGKPARQWHPYAHYCAEPAAEVLESGKAIYHSLPLYAGVNGWDVSEPGTYDIQVAAEVEGQVVFSDPFRLRVSAPASWEQEQVAGDFFTEQVGRALWFSGTTVLDGANATLQNAVDRLSDRRVAIHAATALAQPLVRSFKTLDIPDAGVPMTSVAAAHGMIKERSADVDEAMAIIEDTLETETAAETLGHIGYRQQAESLGQALTDADATEAATSLHSSLHSVLSRRGVLQSVLDEVSRRTGGDDGPRSSGGQEKASKNSSARKNKSTS